MNWNNATDILSKSINILFVGNPRGTSLGALGGYVISIVLEFIEPLIKEVEVVNFAALGVSELILFGIFIANLQDFLGRKKIPEQVEEVLKLIDQEEKSGNISESNAKIKRIALIEKVVDKVSLNEEFQFIND